MYTQAPCIVSLGGVRPSVGVKKWFEALTGKFLPFVVSYISHFICSYNLNYNFRPLRGPSIILIFKQNSLSKNCQDNCDISCFKIIDNATWFYLIKVM